jgi:hypothetical protein
MNNKIVFYVVVSAILFYLLNGLSESTLISVIVVLIIVLYMVDKVDMYGGKRLDSIDDVNDRILKNMKEDSKEHPLETTNYIIEKNTRDFKYLVKDDMLMDIVRKMRFVKRYEKARYNDLLNELNIYMKYYMFMLRDRYDIVHFLPLMHDMYLRVIETMYSFYLVLPVKMKHVFGFKPLDRLEECIGMFREHGKKMIDVVKRHGKSNVHMLDTEIEPYNSRDNLMLP